MAKHSLQSPSRLLDMDAVAVGLIEVDADWRIRRANQVAAAHLGTRPDQLTGSAFAALFESGDALVRRLSDTLAITTRSPTSATPATSAGEALDLMVLPLPPAPDQPNPATAIVTLITTAQRVAQREEIARLHDALAESERARSKMDAVQRELAAPPEPPRTVGSSAPFLAMQAHIARVAPSPATVLIQGESGSGKELVARMIHALSPRREQAMVAVNCAAMPETLLESELFGHERGAFTGADRQRLGKFELADKGTLFLDEVAELSAQAQAKLLRVLQEGTFERVGGVETIHVDVRLVAATHRDLSARVQRGRFREDLFYRLNVFRLEVPPLRERRGDIKELSEFFHDRHARRMARPVLPISERSLRRLLAYRWPGNVRELENTIERATVLSAGPELEVELPEQSIAMPGQHARGTGNEGESGGDGGGDTSAVPRDVLLDLTMDQLHRLQIMHALETRDYKVFGDDGAAAKLGLNPQTLLSRMDKLGIPRPRAMRKAMGRGRPKT